MTALMKSSRQEGELSVLKRSQMNLASAGADAGRVFCPGEALYPGDTLTSEDGNMQLIMQNDGNLVIYRQDTGHQAIWSTHTADADTAKSEFRFQVDGNLVEYRTLYTRNANTNAIEGTEDGVAWASNQYGDLDEGIFLVMQNDGNLVKYSRDKVAKWSSGSDQGIGGNAELGSNYCVPTHAPVAAPTHAPSNVPVAHPTHTPTKVNN